jgi:beta-N-acetylhexosaminidase
MLTRIIKFLLFFSLVITGISQTVFAQEVTLKEKIGQMLLIGFKGTELHPDDFIVKAIMEQRVGGVILFDYDFPTGTYDHNIKNPEQVKQLTTQLQDYTQQAAKNKGNQLYPILIGIDYEGGKVNRLKESYGFPKTLSAADIGQLSFEEADKYARQMAQTLNQAGINLNFAPVLDVNVNPDSPAIGKLGRSFSADPDKVADYAAIFARAYKENGIFCSYKHFPGHGSATGDTHAGFVDVTQTWKEYELNPYKKLFQQPNGCDMVMTAHVVHYGLDSKGYPASISTSITKELLREKLSFTGLVVTDDMQMKAIADNYGLAEAVRMAVNAGADILVFGNQLVPSPQDPQEIVDMIYDDVMTGKISQSRIEEAYQRIMRVKEKLGQTVKSGNTRLQLES